MDDYRHKLFKSIEYSFKKGFTLMLIPNSGDSVKSYRIPLSCIVFILFLLVGNLYMFVGYLTQTVKIFHYKAALQQKNVQIVHLLKERRQIWPTIKKSYHIANELEKLKEERLKMMNLWRNIQYKNRYISYSVNRGINIKARNYDKSNSVENKNENDIDELNRKMNDLQKIVEFESTAYKDLVNSLVNYHSLKSYQPSVNPVWNRRISSWFGNRLHPKLGYWRLHKGIDLKVKSGTKVFAAASGKVIYAGYKSGYGYTVIIDHGHGYQTLYAHNSSIKVKKESWVDKGKIICLSGNTGISTGPHLHYEVHVDGKPVNPLGFMKNN